LCNGFRDYLTGKVDTQAVLSQYGPVINQALNSRLKVRAAADKAEGKKYLDDYVRNNPNAVRTSSGLVFHRLVAGSGPSVKGPKSTVRVHYSGQFVDGEVFDSSLKAGKPAEFLLDDVVAGMAEGIMRMQVGERAVLVIPPELAYGDDGSSPSIPPSCTLIFEIQLIAIVSDGQ
jgi:FKBP-type peptidyl-prolyl cis-trans isomerase